MADTIQRLVALLLVAAFGLTACSAKTVEKTPTSTAPTRALERTLWVLESYGEPGNEGTVLGGTEITADFDGAEGQVSGSAGCNHYFASYKLKDHQLSISAVGSTEMWCGEPAGVMEQEQAYLAAIQAATSYQIHDGQLQVSLSDGREMRYVAASEATPPPTGTPTAVPTPTATPFAVPRLTWDMLKNAAYPNEWPSDGVAQLVDGVYREKYMPDSATELVISLADMHTFGDLDGDGIEDVSVILISHPGGSGTFFYLAAVLNQDGAPDPLAAAFLGDRTIIRSMTIESGQIVLEMITQGPGDPMCCPNMDRRQVYVLQDNHLVLMEQTDIPRTEPAVPIAVEPERIQFPPDATSVTLQGTIFPIGDKKYVLHGQAGQTMSLTVTSPYDHVFLSSYGSDGTVLVSILSETTHWTGELPATLHYVITLVSIAGNETPYTLQVDIKGPAVPTPEPTDTPTAAPGVENVVYLTFDDGPTDPHWTPQVLEVLARHDAKATFFVLGQLAKRYPELIQTQVDAGHSVANHTFDHRTLDGIGREAFFKELEDTEAALGGLGSKCVRPPYGATDAYTRAYAAELGYALVMWNIDTEDWRRPGVDAIVSGVLTDVYPGAILLMHDGGGDRAQTVQALDTILEALGQQGYVFEVVCQ
jgi:peptidoglycan/xylan/chitin deacetylase (PgdA/CDA1 family)/heat shock protein HslJ